jgi:hypothetical protein
MRHAKQQTRGNGRAGVQSWHTSPSCSCGGDSVWLQSYFYRASEAAGMLFIDRMPFLIAAAPTIVLNGLTTHDTG